MFFLKKGHDLVGVGPGSYDLPQMTACDQYDSSKSNNQTFKISKSYTGRLPKELEPIKEKYASSSQPLPSPPKLTPLHL